MIDGTAVAYRARVRWTIDDFGVDSRPELSMGHAYDRDHALDGAGVPHLRAPSAYHRESLSAARINVYVQPRAARTEVVGTHGGAVKIRLAAPPVDGAANDALVEFLSDRLGTRKTNVRVVSGHASRRKVIEIDGVDTATIRSSLGIDR